MKTSEFIKITKRKSLYLEAQKDRLVKRFQSQMSHQKLKKRPSFTR